ASSAVRLDTSSSPIARSNFRRSPRTTPRFLQVLIRQIAKNGEINAVFSKTLGVLGHAEFFQPVDNLLHCGHPTDLTLSVLDRELKVLYTRHLIMVSFQAVNGALRGRIILISVYSPGCVSTSIAPECCFTMMS